jgi:imidazole glycerol-phosphate synthase subunit HisH
MKIAIIKYNAGNISSVAFALERLGVSPIITDNPEIIRQSDKVIFPGVGEASSTMKYLKEKELDKLIPALKQPVLGICLGMQLMCSFSEEGETPCMGIFDTIVKKFNGDFKVPHVGWNSLIHMNGPLFKNLPEESYVYFVHSFYADQNEHSIATTNYNKLFSAAMQKDNFYATQFHPERSGKIGELILKNFIEL